jgi:hypothetical protein
VAGLAREVFQGLEPAPAAPREARLSRPTSRSSVPSQAPLLTGAEKAVETLVARDEALERVGSRRARDVSFADLANGCLVGQSSHRRKVANVRNCKYLREPCTPRGMSPSALDVERRQAFAAWCPCRFFASHGAAFCVARPRSSWLGCFR